MKILTIKRDAAINKNTLLLGPWCLRNFEKINKLNNNILIHPWENKKNKKQNFTFLFKKYYFFLEILAKELNKLHGQKFSIKFWEIILGAWLYEFLGLSYEKYLLINSLKKKIKYTHIGNRKFKLDTPTSIQDFWKLRLSDEYQYNLIFDTIKLSKNKIKFLKTKKKFFKSNIKLQKKKLRFIDKLKFNFFYFNIKYSRFIFDVPYFQFPIKQIIRFLFFPTNFMNFPDYLPKHTHPKNNLRKKFLRKKNTNRKLFDYIFLNLVRTNLPKNYLEYFPIIYKNIKNMGPNVKLIFSAGSYSTNDIFKIWVAFKKKQGTKLIISDHGGALKKYYFFEYLASSICDVYNYYYNSIKKKSMFFNPLIKFNLKIFLSKFLKRKKILIISRDRPWHTLRASPEEIGFELIKTYNNIDNLSKILKANNIDFILRPFSKKKNYINIGEKLFEKYPNKISNYYLDKRYDIYNDFYKSNLTICTYPMTAFVQSLASKRPTILFIFKNQFIFDKEHHKIFKEMENNNLVFYNHEELSNFLKKNYNKIDYWWESRKIKKVRIKLDNLFLNNNNFFNFIQKLKKIA